MICLATILINISGLPINADDKKHLAAAKRHCGELYESKPCVKRFVKVRALTYRVICAAKVKPKTQNPD